MYCMFLCTKTDWPKRGTRISAQVEQEWSAHRPNRSSLARHSASGGRGVYARQILLLLQLQLQLQLHFLFLFQVYFGKSTATRTAQTPPQGVSVQISPATRGHSLVELFRFTTHPQ